MKISRILATGIIVTCFSITTAFAAPGVSSSPNTNGTQITDTVNKDKKDTKSKEFHQKRGCDKEVDPIKALECKKQKIQLMLKEGRITKDDAKTKIAAIDARIEKLKEFNSLSPQQKKDKLTKDFKLRIDQRVKDGKLTQEKADELVKKFNEKVQKWDGNGYPPFHKKGFKLQDKLENNTK